MEFPETVDGVDIHWLGHASIKLIDSDDAAVYIDPWSEVMHEAAEHPAADIIMDQDEAIEAIQMIQPCQAVPIHYGTIDETTADSDRFAADVADKTAAEPLILDQQRP